MASKVDARREPFGPHTCRKTAYLFAVGGGGDEAEMMQAARHRSIQQAVNYKRDAFHLLNLAVANDVNFRALTCS